MIRIDIAGNISKRFSASGLRFARFSGACPRWNVFEAFLTPGMIRTQLSQMPDGKIFYHVARTVRKESGGYPRRRRNMPSRSDATSRTIARWSTRTVSISPATRRSWRSGRRAGCATGWIASSAHVHRCSTRSRSTNRSAASRSTRPSAADPTYPRTGIYAQAIDLDTYERQRDTRLQQLFFPEGVVFDACWAAKKLVQ